jgi:hypothetical protein
VERIAQEDACWVAHKFGNTEATLNSRMNISAPFIARLVTTTLLTLAIVMAGGIGFSKLPVSLLPWVDYPTIVVNARLPGASPGTVATSVAEPLERHLGQIADVTEMTSQSAMGGVGIVLQFDVNRDINGASQYKPRSTPPAPICPLISRPTQPITDTIPPMDRSLFWH